MLEWFSHLLRKLVAASPTCGSESRVSQALRGVCGKRRLKTDRLSSRRKDAKLAVISWPNSPPVAGSSLPIDPAADPSEPEPPNGHALLLDGFSSPQRSNARRSSSCTSILVRRAREISRAVPPAPLMVASHCCSRRCSRGRKTEQSRMSGYHRAQVAS